MKFTKPVNLWTMQDSQIKALQAGQWVYGGSGLAGQYQYATIQDSVYPSTSGLCFRQVN
jgi:hypothetical protein